VIFRYGNYIHANHEVGLEISHEQLYNEGGQHYADRWQWVITGFIQAADQASLTLLLAALELSYAIQGQDVGFFLDDGVTPTAHGILAASTLGGPRVIRGPEYVDNGVNSAEYSTFRSYKITLEYIVPGGDGLLAFTEHLSFEGGGPRWGYLQTLNGVPPAQLLAQVTPQRIIQQGSAIGYLSYPPPPPSLFPALLHTDMSRVQRRSPKRTGPVGRPQWYEYPVEWYYFHESTVPLDGVPNRWF